MLALFVYESVEFDEEPKGLQHIITLETWDDILTFISSNFAKIEWINDLRLVSYELSIPKDIVDAFIDEYDNVYVMYNEEYNDDYDDRHLNKSERDRMWERLLNSPSLLRQRYLPSFETFKADKHNTWYVGALKNDSI